MLSFTAKRTTIQAGFILSRAIKGNGGSVRYVILPDEAHAYAALESIEDMLAARLPWFHKFVKNAGPREMSAEATSKAPS